MRLKKSIGIFTVTLGLLMMSGQAKAGTILISPSVNNGSFEDGSFVANNGTGMSLAAGSTAISGWTVVQGELAWLPSGYAGIAASEGNRFLDLSGWHDSTPYGGVTLTGSLTTVPGSYYQVVFDFGNSSLNSNTPSIIVQVDSNTPLTFTAPPASIVTQWTTESFVFMATSSSTSLKFTGAGPSPNNYIGLDNVNVLQVIEPGLVLLLGLGLGAATLLACRWKI